MSKSLGNFFTIRDVIAQYHPLALRWFLISTHYRQPINYTQQALDEVSCHASDLLALCCCTGKVLEPLNSILPKCTASPDEVNPKSESSILDQY